MKEHTIRLLKECNAGCKMAVSSMEQVRDFVQDDKLAGVIDDYKGRHEKLERESSALLESCGEKEKEPGKLASAFSWTSTETKLMMKNDSRQIGKIMMDGCNMGIQSISEDINKYSQASQESKELAKNLVRTEESFMRDMKQFL